VTVDGGVDGALEGDVDLVDAGRRSVLADRGRGVGGCRPVDVERRDVEAVAREFVRVASPIPWLPPVTTAVPPTTSWPAVVG